VWKRQQKSASTKIIHRDEIIVGDFYNQHLSPLFRIFSKQLSQFNDIFWKAEETPLINNEVSDLEFSDYIIKSPARVAFKDTINVTGKSRTIITLPRINRLSLQYSLVDYKYNERNSFTIESIIDIQFDKYSYTISYKDQILSTKKYSEYLSAEEINSLVRTCVKNVFEEIKEKSK
ncbi:MAG TPA: hypothetical protein VJ720_02335, partial [Chitinophaga sp.]|nr:hypothetical protein [Chitinophaga sp.]